MPAGKKASGLPCRCLPGLFLGLEDNSDECFVGTADGVVKARTIRRLAPDARADADLLGKLAGVPWKPVPSAPESDSIPVAIRLDARPVVPASELPSEPTHAESLARGLYIRREVELEKFGYTEGCLGCTAAFMGAPAMPHSAECRQRIMKAMKDAANKERKANGRH